MCMLSGHELTGRSLSVEVHYFPGMNMTGMLIRNYTCVHIVI